MIEEIRSTGAAIRLIPYGDVAGIMHCAEPAVTGIDMYMGSGGAAEGVFGKGAKGLGEMIERILKDQGEPNAYIAGREASDCNRCATISRQV